MRACGHWGMVSHKILITIQEAETDIRLCFLYLLHAFSKNNFKFLRTRTSVFLVKTENTQEQPTEPHVFGHLKNNPFFNGEKCDSATKKLRTSKNN